MISPEQWGDLLEALDTTDPTVVDRVTAVVERIDRESEATQPKRRKETISAREAAEILKVHPNSIWNWCKAGRFPHEVTPGGQRRLYRRDVEELAARMERDRRSLSVTRPGRD